MTQLIYRGILSGQHSWVVVGTELCNALNELGVDIAIQSTNRTDQLDSRLASIVDKKKERAAIGIGYTVPRNLRLFNSNKKICIYNYETTVMPPGWAKELNQYADLILPSSTFAKNIFIQNGVSKEKTHVLPHGVDTRLYHPNISPADLGTDKFKFLCVAAPHARKGLDILLEAYSQEFSASDPVVLVLKTDLKGRNRHSYEISVQDLIRHYRAKYAMPEVRVVTDNMETLAPLYTACDAFVTASRSECFCLPILEAMACKLPIITTGYGGQTDFATAANSFQISYKMVQAPKTMQYWHYDKRGKIAEPNIAHLRTVMRYVYTHYSDAMHKAEMAYEDVITRYTWQNVGLELLDLIDRQKWGKQYRLRSASTNTTPPKQAEQGPKYEESLVRRRDRLDSLKQEIQQKQQEFKRIEQEIDKIEVKHSDKELKRLNQAYNGQVSIVVLNYNTKKATHACIESIKQHTQVNYELIVVDNGSTDGSKEYLSDVPDIKTIFNASNLGVAKGWNQGIAAANEGNDIVVLNSDIVVTKDWLERLNKTAYKDPTIGVVGCRIKGSDQYKGKILHTGAIIQRDGMGQENEWGIPLPDHGQYQIDRPVQIVVGACMYLKRAVLDKVGVFDEDYSPAYFEDSDMCMKIAKAGYQVYYCGQVTLFHEHGATGRANKMDVANLLQHNRKRFLSKWSTDLNEYKGGVEIRGPIYGPSGYAEACRNLTMGLWENDVDVAYTPITAHPSEKINSNTNQTNLVVQDAIRNTATYDVGIVFYLADYFATQFRGKRRRIGYTMLEVDGVPASWVQYCNAYLTELWVPSVFNQHTFKKSGVRIPIRVVPLGVDTNRFNPYVMRSLPKRDDKFRFLSVCEMGERKNVHMLMRAFQAEFKKNERVELVLRITNSDPSVNVERELRHYDLRNVMLLTRHHSIHEMPSLYSSADAFVLPSSGEGWGLPYMEAMATGLPTIGTAWSANIDFMNRDNSYLINVERIAPAVARCPYYKGFNWAIPDIKHLRQLMRHVFENQEEARAKGAQASRDVLKNYSLTTIGKIAQRYLLG